MQQSRRWTEEDETKLRLLASVKSVPEIARQLNRTPAAIIHRSEKLRLTLKSASSPPGQFVELPAKRRLRLIPSLVTIASLVTILYGILIAFEEYKKTLPDIELSGEIDDQSHPYNIPLVVKDQSAVFNLYDVEVSSHADMVMDFGGAKIPGIMNDLEIHKTPLVTPSTPFFFISKPMSTLTIQKNDTKELVPVDHGALTVKIKYKLSMFWLFKLGADVPVEFSLIRTPKGLRWIKAAELSGFTPKP